MDSPKKIKEIKDEFHSMKESDPERDTKLRELIMQGMKGTPGYFHILPATPIQTDIQEISDIILKKRFKITFWTESGGCSRFETKKSDTLDEIKTLIAEDLTEEPYINFWYGQYIDIKDRKTGEEFQIYTHDNHPIKMKICVNGKTYDSMEALETEEEDEEIEKSTYDTVTEGMFAGGETIEKNDDLTDVKMIFRGEGYDFSLEYVIDYAFLDEFR